MGKTPQEWQQVSLSQKIYCRFSQQGYVYEKLDGLFLIDDKKGKNKIAKERNNNALQIAALIKCERIKEYMNGMVGIKKKALRDMALKDWMLTYAERKKRKGKVEAMLLQSATLCYTLLYIRESLSE